MLASLGMNESIIHLACSKNHGLHLIMDDVVESGPAWESGVRQGDVIVTVNDWLIVLMDRAQVSSSLQLSLLLCIV